ncbi:DUF2946 domain-containing protein [Piscinibacter aquaticus]|uniref:DUF2946 domain-containing protein n=1 Tax=Piscinibacter aquaticus TaxID=392597 RepID=A0A5C6TNR8_9BURK|nr:DUF2946 domain-containing protein [Piscinibacter aquaticus]
MVRRQATLESRHACRSRVVNSWIAILAVLMTSLAPAISHAMGTRGPATWTGICASAGAKRVLLDAQHDSDKSVPGAANPLEHCPYCGLHADGFPDTPSLPSMELSVWSSAQPRALLPSRSDPSQRGVLAGLAVMNRVAAVGGHAVCLRASLTAHRSGGQTRTAIRSTSRPHKQWPAEPYRESRRPVGLSQTAVV